MLEAAEPVLLVDAAKLQIELLATTCFVHSGAGYEQYGKVPINPGKCVYSGSAQRRIASAM
jgi:hypothetical protein